MFINESVTTKFKIFFSSEESWIRVEFKVTRYTLIKKNFVHFIVIICSFSWKERSTLSFMFLWRYGESYGSWLLEMMFDQTRALYSLFFSSIKFWNSNTVRSYKQYLQFPKRYYSWRILLRLHRHADSGRLAWSAVWRDAGVRDLSRNRFYPDYADAFSSTNECRSSDYSSGDRGAGFGKYPEMATLFNSTRVTINTSYVSLWLFPDVRWLNGPLWLKAV